MPTASSAFRGLAGCRRLLLGLSAGALLSGCSTLASDHDLALRFAPVHYQDTDDSDEISDYVTAVDYDGDWTTTNNWDNLKTGRADQRATAYYSVVESCTHWFIVYSFYHPRDWTDTSFDQEHENDLEGALAIVRKTGARDGRVEGLITVFHNDFYSYVPQGGPLTNGAEDIDGVLRFQSVAGAARFKTSQQAKGHGLKAWPHAGDFDGSSDQDGIVYFPTAGAGERPSSGNDRNVAYGLEDALGEMWFMQIYDAGRPAPARTTFISFGTFRGDSGGTCGDGLATCADNAAHAPWGWDDGDDGPVYAGEMALDPIHVVDHYFNGLGSFGTTYVRNGYLQGLRDAGYNDANRPQGWSSSLSLDALYRKLGAQCR